MQDHQAMIEKVRQALGRTAPLAQAPTPPPLDETITRLVQPQSDLKQIFLAAAESMKMKTAQLSPENLAPKLIEFLRENNCHKIALADSLDRHGIPAALHNAGLEAKSWQDMTLDELYDNYDCAITDVMYAVAETGSLVIHPTAAQGRALSLVPMIHVAIVEPNNIVPDLVDLMQRLAAPDQPKSNIILITGPSKTADIEMNVVTGVHGPNIVKVFLLEA
jgi:L-lactate dehydrogenase complex protein LldG